jgi:hypothetical protein
LLKAAFELWSNVDSVLQDDTKKVDKTRKRLQNARLDMDSTRGRLQAAEKQAEKSNREYQMGKIDALKSDVDEVTKKFEDCQDAYATELFTFMSREQLYTEKLLDFVRKQVSMLKQGVASLEGMLPTIEKKMSESHVRPLFGMSLAEHSKLGKREVALVIQDCVEALRDGCLDTEGLFRIAGSATKVKFLKNSFNAQQRNAKDHDPHTVAGCLKRYLRELPEPILTYELYTEFMSSVQLADTNTTLQKMNDLLLQLPPSHNANLKYLLAFLHEFAQYHEMTKMTTGNIAIVMGPNLLWPEGDLSDNTAAAVSDTAVQRRVAELLIDKVHWFYPDLPETPTPAPFIKQTTYVSSHGVNPSGVYTPTGPLSSYGTPPPTSPSPADSTPSSSTSSSITEDLQSNTSPSQTTPPLHITHETLAEMRSSSPKPANTVSPPIRPRPYRGSGPVSGGNGQQTPPSPSPRSGSFTRPASSEISNCTPVDPTDGIGEGSLANQRPEEPTIKAPPQVTPRKKKPDPWESPKVGGVSPSVSGSSGEKRPTKGPSRRAPPPPISKKPGAARQLSNEEVSTL